MAFEKVLVMSLVYVQKGIKLAEIQKVAEKNGVKMASKDETV